MRSPPGTPGASSDIVAIASYRINCYDRGCSGSRARPSRPRRLARARFFGVTLVQIHGLLLAATTVDPYVQKLHEHREGHGEVDVALGDVLVEALKHQHEPHQDQEAQRQHLQRGVSVDEAAYRPGRDHHDADRDHHGGDHHAQFVHHPNSGYHRVQREHDVEEDDLYKDGAEGRLHPGIAVALLALELVVDLVGGLAQQEQAAADKYQIPARYLLGEDRKERLGKTSYPGDREKQHDAHKHRQSQTYSPS